jgi:hypothetical protein
MNRLKTSPSFDERPGEWALHNANDNDEKFNNIVAITSNDNVNDLAKTDLEENADDICTLESVAQAESGEYRHQNSSTGTGSRRWYHNEHAR